MANIFFVNENYWPRTTSGTNLYMEVPSFIYYWVKTEQHALNMSVQVGLSTVDKLKYKENTYLNTLWALNVIGQENRCIYA